MFKWDSFYQYDVLFIVFLIFQFSFFLFLCCFSCQLPLLSFVHFIHFFSGVAFRASLSLSCVSSHFSLSLPFLCLFLYLALTSLSLNHHRLLSCTFHPFTSLSVSSYCYVYSLYFAFSYSSTSFSFFPLTRTTPHPPPPLLSTALHPLCLGNKENWFNNTVTASSTRENKILRNNINERVKRRALTFERKKTEQN